MQEEEVQIIEEEVIVITRSPSPRPLEPPVFEISVPSDVENMDIRIERNKKIKLNEPRNEICVCDKDKQLNPIRESDERLVSDRKWYDMKIEYISAKMHFDVEHQDVTYNLSKITTRCIRSQYSTLK